MTLPDSPSLIVKSESTEAPPAEPIEERAPVSRGRLVLRRFLRRKSAMLGLVLVLLMFAMAYLGPLFYEWDHTEIDFLGFLQPPSAEYARS